MTNLKLKCKNLIVGLWHRDAGQSFVEIALTLPVVAILLVGAAEFARVAYVAIEVSNAAKAGVAYGAQSASNAADTSGIQNAATLDAGNITLSTPTVTLAGICSDGTTCNNGGGPCLNTDCNTVGNHIETIVSVDTAATFTPLIHLPGFPASYTLHGHATQICLP